MPPPGTGDLSEREPVHGSRRNGNAHIARREALPCGCRQACAASPVAQVSVPGSSHRLPAWVAFLFRRGDAYSAGSIVTIRTRHGRLTLHLGYSLVGDGRYGKRVRRSAVRIVVREIVAGIAWRSPDSERARESLRFEVEKQASDWGLSVRPLSGGSAALVVFLPKMLRVSYWIGFRRRL